jgi:hypothetical protein
MIVIGGISDQLVSLVWEQISMFPFSIKESVLAAFPVYAHLFREFMFPFQTNQPMLWFFLSAFLSIFGKGAYNAFLLLTVFANLGGAYFFFKRFKFGFLYSLIYAFSSYMWIHLGVHPTLSHIWVFPVFLELFLRASKDPTAKNLLIAGLFWGFLTSLSNYSGFIVLVFLFCFFIVNVVIKKSVFKRLLRVYVICSALFFISTFAFLFPYIKVNYLGGSPSESTHAIKLQRPTEDFFLL